MISGLFIFTGNSAGFAGLQTGAAAKAMKKNEQISRRVAAINVDKEHFAVILPTDTTLRVEFKNIQKIENTGIRKKITPNQSCTAGNYKIYRFTFIDGKNCRRAVAKWPVFDIGTTGIDGSFDFFIKACKIQVLNYTPRRLRLAAAISSLI